MNPLDHSPDRRGTDSTKWSRYAPDVLPMWVADMDVAVALPIQDALRQRLAHPVFGYAAPDPRLLDVIAARMGARYGWAVKPEDVVLLPGVVPGFNMAVRALVPAGGAIVYHSPAYPPIRQVARHWGLRDAPIPVTADAAALQAALSPGDAFLLCNPHNPTGHAYTAKSLTALAESCLSAGAWIIADEIHCDLLFDGRRHVPIASLAPEIARRTITLMSPGKAFNIAGLKIGFAIIQDAELRARVLGCRLGMVDSVNGLGMAATHAAFTAGGAWLDALIPALAANRDHLLQAVATRLPGVRMVAPEATFLAWLDLREAGLGPDPAGALLERGRIGLNPGPDFGAPGFARLNFGCPLPTLDEGIARIAACLKV
ncbi:MalY/PatB family protein [Falsiroseomonas sp.]|uniref:MalY/PatB family protein n=1 Tax=Falsiroseomonas sp. TaxID=2870721 RepID=UPI002723A445|nr:PatB family C-S lyase [Falsiroseomonas sp.]MDO9503524.1 PatB family C-S lyase [Falsiroseomonas sp.]